MIYLTPITFHYTPCMHACMQLGDLMGQGEFGPVMKAVARYLVPGQFETEVAVKILVSESVVDPENGFRADLAIMDYANQMKLENKHVSSILGLCSDKEPFYVIYEYLDQVSIDTTPV